MLAGSVPGKLHHRGASTAFWGAMPKSSQYLQAALSLEISTGGAADYRRPTVFQSHTAVKGVHSALPRCNYVGMAWGQAETSSGAVVKTERRSLQLQSPNRRHLTSCQSTKHSCLPRQRRKNKWYRHRRFFAGSWASSPSPQYLDQHLQLEGKLPTQIRDVGNFAQLRLSTSYIFFKFLSINWVSAGFRPGPPARCPHIDGIMRSSALGICRASISLSTGGKYWSVSDGMMIALAFIVPNAW